MPALSTTAPSEPACHYRIDWAFGQAIHSFWLGDRAELCGPVDACHMLRREAVDILRSLNAFRQDREDPPRLDQVNMSSECGIVDGRSTSSSRPSRKTGSTSSQQRKFLTTSSFYNDLIKRRSPCYANWAKTD